MILAGDVGGTKTHLALFDVGPPLRRVRLETFRSATSASLEAMLDAFVRGTGTRLVGAAFGVAGPVVRDVAVLPNLTWAVDATRVAERLGLASVILMNDLEASAWSLASMGDGETVTLLEGASPAAVGNQAIISAGTGLGEALLVRSRARPASLPSEAGHADFAPRSDLDMELFRWLRERYGHVSWERVVSGPGLVNIHAFLVETGRGAEPDSVTQAVREAGAAAISAAAFEGRSERCALALDVFISAYGAEAGNLALRAVATGGVFLGGGIAPKILPWLRREPFRRAFLEKGRLSPLVAGTPVKVILDEHAVLLGAAARAADAVGGEPNALS